MQSESRHPEVADSSPPPQDWSISGEGHPRRWAILAVLVVSLLVVVLDSTVLNIALPTIQGELHATQSELTWAVDSYIVVFAALLFTWGVLGDRFGRKRILIVGLLIFGSASAFSAFASTPLWLTGSRGLMGVGGAAVMPATLAIITVVFPPHERGRAIGTWAGAVGAAISLGPVLGGLLLAHPEWTRWLTGNSWGSVFLINVPIVIVGIVGILRIVPETRNPRRQRLDFVGLVLSFTGLLSLVYGIIHASSVGGWRNPGVLGPVGLGLLLIAGFLVYEWRSSGRSFDVRLFRNRGYAVSLGAVSLTFFAMTGIMFSLPFYLQVLRGYGTLQAGLAFMPFAVGQLIAAPNSARMVERFGYRAVMTTGLAIVATSLAALTRLNMDTNMVLVLIGFFAFGLGMGNVIAPSTSVMQNILPLSRAGAGSAVQNTVRQVFGALGVATVGAVLGTQYASRSAEVFAALPPEFPRAQAEESVVATNQVLSAWESQGGVPTDQIELIRAGAFEAFLGASQVAVAISTVMVVIAALLVAFLLPRIRPPRVGDRSPRDTWDQPQEVTEREIENVMGLAPDAPASD
ncbi:MAG: MFS transporter [Candidatus Nanopelagicales bacterium]|nr:MFS transporter [Candidatus Nanopelagicales bacterium]